jgi:hypothetical protein
VHEQTTAAVDVSVSLDTATETRVLRACVDFYSQHIRQHALARCSSNSRPSQEAIALATLYLMRDGIPGILKADSFVSASLPDLSRLKNYGFQINKYTQARRLIQNALEKSFNAVKHVPAEESV